VVLGTRFLRKLAVESGIMPRASISPQDQAKRSTHCRSLAQDSTTQNARYRIAYSGHGSKAGRAHHEPHRKDLIDESTPQGAESAGVEFIDKSVKEYGQKITEAIRSCFDSLSLRFDRPAGGARVTARRVRAPAPRRRPLGRGRGALDAGKVGSLRIEAWPR